MTITDDLPDDTNSSRDVRQTRPRPTGSPAPRAPGTVTCTDPNNADLAAGSATVVTIEVTVDADATSAHQERGRGHQRGPRTETDLGHDERRRRRHRPGRRPTSPTRPIRSTSAGAVLTYTIVVGQRRHEHAQPALRDQPRPSSTRRACPSCRRAPRRASAAAYSSRRHGRRAPATCSPDRAWISDHQVRRPTAPTPSRPVQHHPGRFRRFEFAEADEINNVDFEITSTVEADLCHARAIDLVDGSDLRQPGPGRRTARPLTCIFDRDATPVTCPRPTATRRSTAVEIRINVDGSSNEYTGLSAGSVNVPGFSCTVTSHAGDEWQQHPGDPAAPRPSWPVVETSHRVGHRDRRHRG